MVLAVLVLEELEPVGCHLNHVGQVAVYLFNLGLDTCHQLVGLVLVELQDTLHLDFQQLEDVILCHLTYQLWVEGCQAFIDILTDGIDGWCLLEFLILIDTFFDKNLFQRTEMQLFHQLALAYL